MAVVLAVARVWPDPPLTVRALVVALAARADPPQAVVLAVALAVVLAVALAVRARVWPDTNKFNFRTGLS